MIKDSLFLNKLDEISSLNINDVPTPSSEPAFSVNLNTRVVKVPSDFEELAVYMDHNAETVWFSINRYFDGVDLYSKNYAIQITNSERNLLLPITDRSLPNPTILEGTEEETLLLGWTITSDVTKLKGTSYVQLRIFSLNEDKTLNYNLSTKPFSIRMAKGEYVSDETPDIDPAPTTLNELVARIEDLYQNETATNIQYTNIKADTLPIINNKTINGVRLNSEGKVEGKIRLGETIGSLADYPDANVSIPLKFGYLSNVPKVNGVALAENQDIVIETASSITEGTSDTKGAEAQAVDKYVTNRLTKYVATSSFAEGGFANTEVNKLIDAKLEGLTFTPIAILNYILENQFVELKTTIDKVKLEWELSKDSLSSTIKYGEKEVPALTTAKTSHIIEDSFDSNTVFTLSVSDGKNTITNEIELQFVPKIYYGAAAAPDSYDSAFIQALSDFELRADRLTSVSVNAGSEEFIYLAIPQSYGDAAFNVGGFDGGFESAIEVSGLYDGEVTYNLYKSDNSNLGNTLVKVL